MEEKIIVIKGDTSDADKKVKGLSDNVGKLGKTAEKTTDKASKGAENIGKSAKGSSKGVGLLSKGFKGLGTAIKAAGIGLVVGAVVALGSAFASNQKFMNAFNTVTETFGIVLSQVATALINVYESVAQSSSNFDALGKVMGGLLKIAITPLKLAFFGIKLGIQQAQLIWEKSFFGDGDKTKIAALTVGILETKTAILDTGKEALQAGKEVAGNFGEAITEVGEISKKVVTEVGKISVKSAIETAKGNVQIRNSAKLAQAEQGRLIEIYDRLAEKQRQIRDDESISIKDRKIANDELGKILEKQEKSLLKQAQLQIASAQADVNKNNTIDNQVALTEALANKEGVLASVEGFRSEQIVNRIALKKEEIELDNSINDAEKERQIQQIEFEASQEVREVDKLEKQRERLDLENEIILEDIERKRELYLEGTQARIDAEQLYLTEKQRIDNEITDNERVANLEKEKDAKLLEDAKIAFAQNGLSLIGALAKEGSAIGKAVAATQATVAGIQGVQNAYTTAQASPITTLLPAYPLIQAGLAGAFSAVQVKKILSTKSASGGGGAPRGGDSGGGASAPSFNLVQGTDSNQIAQSINQGNKTPTQAFVVGSAVTTQQELDRNKISISSI